VGGKGTGRRHGYVVSEETKQKLRKKLSGKKNPMYGIRGEDHPLYNVSRPDEVRKKISEGMKRYKKLQKEKLQKSKKKVAKKRNKK